MPQAQVIVRTFLGAQLIKLMLREVSDLEFAGLCHAPLHQVHAAGQEFQQSRLAVAIGAQQRDTVVAVDAQR